MRIFPLLKIFWLFVTLSFLGCGAPEEEKDFDRPSDPPPASPKPDQPPLDQPSPSPQPPDSDEFNLSGKWSSGCLVPRDSESYPFVIAYKFSEPGETFREIHIKYRDDNCQRKLYAYIIDGALSFTAVAESETNAKEYELDLKALEANLVAYDNEVVQIFNADSYYGYADWQLDRAKPIMGRTDPGGNVVEVSTSYNTVKFNHQELIMSAFSDSPEQRSKEYIVKFNRI